jgi:acyl carrier protein
MSADNDSITAAVVAAIRQVLRDTGREPAAAEPQMLLVADIGLDSLDLAQTIVLLERSLGVDPFRAPAQAPNKGTVRPAIRTVADLVGIYRQFAPLRPSPGQP